MDTTLLQQAKENYKLNSYFFSATGNLKSPLRVDGIIKISDHHRDTIICESGGVIYTEGVWAKKVN